MKRPEQPTVDSPLSVVARHHCWATARLLKFCSELDSDSRGLAGAGTYGRVDQTLAHVIGSEEYYLYALTGEKPEHPLEPKDIVDLVDLQNRAHRNSEVLMKLIRSEFRASDWSKAEREGESMSKGNVLAQLLFHGAEHRAQIATSLGAAKVEPPDLSGWAFALTKK